MCVCQWLIVFLNFASTTAIVSHYSLVFFAYMHTTFLITPPPSLQADVTGLCWVRFIGPSSSTLEAPQDDPVLKTYAQLLSEG